MTPVGNGLNQRSCDSCIMSSVPALFRPLLYKVPMVAKNGILLDFLQTRQFQISNFDQISQIMSVACIDGFLVRKFVTLG